MFVSVDSNGIVQATSPTYITQPGHTTYEIPAGGPDLLGKPFRPAPKKAIRDLRIAGMCNWGDQCGIATYSEQLIAALRQVVKEVKIFAEEGPDTSKDKEQNVVRCWRRGQSCIQAVQMMLDYKPDVVFIQHEFGIFPKATHFLKLLEMLDSTPYAITLHSVYEHLDKTVCTSYIKNIVIHNPKGKECLTRLGHRRPIHILPHGCNLFTDTQPLWNIFQNEHAVIQFGFGFEYKGLDKAVAACKILKERGKFEDIFYCYLCSENVHTRNIHNRYYSELRQLITEQGLDENMVTLRGYLSDQHMRNFLRTAKLAVFPYRTDPKNVVYGASGAIRNAMSNGIPVIASDCHMFDDLEGVVPRPGTPEQLADEIAKVFGSHEYRIKLLKQASEYIIANSWEKTAEKYAEILAGVQ